MKPANGRYRLTWGTPPNTVLYTVDDLGIQTTFGLLAWNETAGMFAHALQDIAIECTGAGTFNAIHGTQNITGTCVPA